MRKYINLFEEFNSSKLFENFDEKTAKELVDDVKKFLEDKDIKVTKGPTTEQSWSSTQSPASKAFNEMKADKKAVIWIRDVAAAGENDYWSKDAPMWVEMLITPNIIDDVKEIASQETTDGLLSFIGDTNMEISDTIKDKSGWAYARILGKTNLAGTHFGDPWKPDGKSQYKFARRFGDPKDTYIPSLPAEKDPLRGGSLYDQ